MAVCRADHQASGWTSVPSGWLARPCRTSFPVSASRMTTLQDCVEESIPATSVMVLIFRQKSARAHDVVDGELVQLHEVVALRAGRVGVVFLEGAAVVQQ